MLNIMKIHYLINGMQTNLVVDTTYKCKDGHSLMSGSIIKPFMQNYEYEVIGSVPTNDNIVIVNLRPYCDNAKRVHCK